MHCHACGSQVPDDVKFCTVCGAFFTDEPAEEEKKPAEEPVVEVVEDSLPEDPFTEELSEEEAPDNDDPFFIPPMPQEPAAAEDEDADFEVPESVIPAGADAALDPTSPEFDPRKFAGLDLEAFHPTATAVEVAASEEPEAPEQPAKKPRKAKSGRGSIVALVIALVLVLLAAAAGLLYWLTMPVKELVAEDNFIQYIGLDVGKNVTEFVIDKRETSRLHRQDTIWCSAVIEDGSVHVECDHVMNYRLTTDGWQLVAVDELNTETWVLKPMVGASEEEVAAALAGQQIQIDDSYAYTLTETDAETAEVLGQTTDLDAGTDVVEATVSVVGELVGWTVDVELEMTFQDGWQLAALTHGEPVVEFKPGMEFEQTEDDFLQVLAANPIPFAQPEDDVTTTVVTDGEAAEAASSAAQMISLPESQISRLTVVETAFDMEENTQIVTLDFELDKQVAKLHVEAAISYVFDDGWKVDTITYAPTVTGIVLNGEWKGTYTESEGRTPSVTLTIADNEDGTDNNVFAFGPSEANPYFFTGKYYVSDEADLETLAVSLQATDWVLYYNPGGVALVGLEGYLMLDDAVITDGKTFTITLQRETEEAAEEAAPAEALVAREVEVTAPFITTPVVPEQTDEPEEEITAPVETTEPEETTEPDVSAAPEEAVLPLTPEVNDPYLGENDTPIL